MPLLKKKEFRKVRTSEGFRDNEEVFMCHITNEIFREYDEFCTRVILCNSMVWTCGFTGKSGLTFTEALESERCARKWFKDFPTDLRVPVLFITTKTQRNSFHDMLEDVYGYVKDRYFIGENVEASFTGNKWRSANVQQVISPLNEKLKKVSKNGQAQHGPPAVLYHYEVEQTDSEDPDLSEIMIVSYDHIRRKKKLSRDKLKLFLKQYVEQNELGIFTVKPSVLEKFNISNVTFDQIYEGSVPIFDVSKKVVKNGKNIKQATLVPFLKNKNVANPVPKIPNKKPAPNGLLENSVNLIQKMRQEHEHFQQKKEELKRKRAEARIKQKEENLKISLMLKEWYKPKEDLELEDHKMLPVPVPIHTQIPEEHIGDVFTILEFVKTFSKFLSVNSFFPGGLTMELMERALTEKEVAGPLMDLIHMLLSALFSVQLEEASQYNTKVDISSDIKGRDYNDNVSLTEASHFATLASNWSSTYQGTPLTHLPLYTLTTSEILRLHLLASGARLNDTGSRWRYQYRGGYTSEDDPGLYFRLKHPHILKALSVHCVTELPTGDILKIIDCLMSQLLTYADIRDLVEDQLEKSKQAKLDYKTTLLLERRQEQEYATAKFKIRKECKENNVDPTEQLDALSREAVIKKAASERKLIELMKLSKKHQTYLGQDRAFRKYLKLDSIPGLWINFEEDNPGYCYEECIQHNSNLVNAGRSEIIAHVRKVRDETNTSDKENAHGASIKNSCNIIKDEVDVNRSTIDLDKLETHTNDKENSSGASIENSSNIVKGEVDVNRATIDPDKIETKTSDKETSPGASIENSSNIVKDEVGVSRATIDSDQLETNNSDKENSPGASIENSSNVAKEEVNVYKSTVDPNKLLICNSHPKTCIVHSSTASREKWSYFNNPEQITELVNSLNPRGIQESELKQTIIDDQDHFCNLVEKTARFLNFKPEVPEEIKDEDGEQKYKNNRPKSKQKYENATLGFPKELSTALILQSALVENILDIEEKIFAGNLGSIKIKDREIWRTSLASHDYVTFGKVCKKDNKINYKIKENGRSSRSSTPDITKEYQDPGIFLGSGNSDIVHSEPIEEHKLAIHCLAQALAQVAEGVDIRYLKKPLGNVAMRTDNNKAVSDILDKWRNSLLASTSYCQIFLHYNSLDTCILWARSALLARCVVCRKQRDSENMLLCDNCNKGMHLYCHKPKLTSVPKGDWFCIVCRKQKEAEEKLKNPTPAVQKRRRIFIEDDSSESDDTEEEVVRRVTRTSKRRKIYMDRDESSEQSDASVIKTRSRSGNSEKKRIPIIEDGSSEQSNSEVEEPKPSDADDDISEESEYVADTEEEKSELENSEEQSGGDQSSEEEGEEDNIESKSEEEQIKSEDDKSEEDESEDDQMETSDSENEINEEQRMVEQEDANVQDEGSRILKTIEDVQINNIPNGDLSEDEGVNGDNQLEVCEKCGIGGTLLCCDNCPDLYHLECASPPLRRVPRGEWFCHKCKSSKKKEGSDHSRRSIRRDDLPLNNAQLQEALSEVMKQDFAWPFIRPVNKHDVPDYYDIILNPMDFGTIKYKLNMGRYRFDADLMTDVALVFENCKLYNNSQDEVYQCGLKMLTCFVDKCHELGLLVPRALVNRDVLSQDPSIKSGTEEMQVD